MGGRNKCVVQSTGIDCWTNKSNREQKLPLDLPELQVKMLSALKMVVVGHSA